MLTHARAGLFEMAFLNVNKVKNEDRDVLMKWLFEDFDAIIYNEGKCDRRHGCSVRVHMRMHGYTRDHEHKK